VNASRYGEGPCGERHVSGRGQGGGWRNRELYQSEPLHQRSLARALLCGAGMEENMTSIKQAIQEWGYPATILISWMMATAYTLAKII
jgi:hypothetical protein